MALNGKTVMVTTMVTIQTVTMPTTSLTTQASGPIQMVMAMEIGQFCQMETSSLTTLLNGVTLTAMDLETILTEITGTNVLNYSANLL